MVVLCKCNHVQRASRNNNVSLACTHPINVLTTLVISTQFPIELYYTQLRPKFRSSKRNRGRICSSLCEEICECAPHVTGVGSACDGSQRSVLSSPSCFCVSSTCFETACMRKMPFETAICHSRVLYAIFESTIWFIGCSLSPDKHSTSICGDIQILIAWDRSASV